MKRIYLKPEMFIIKYIEEAIMLSESESTRNIGGGPTQDPENPLTPGVEDWTNEDDDPYQGGGQGGNGAGNRSKGGLWDDWDDEE
jgi:hypothetical protein